MAELDLQGAIAIQVRATCDKYLNPNGSSHPSTWTATVAIRRVNNMQSTRTVTGAEWSKLTFGKGDVLSCVAGWIEILLPNGEIYPMQAGGLFSTDWSPHKAMEGWYGGCTEPSQKISGGVGR